MKEQLTELLNTLYEAEGLAEMALRRRAAASDRVTRLVVEKCYEVARRAADIPLTEESGDNTAEPDETPLYAGAPAPAAAEDPLAAEVEAEEEEAVKVFTQEVLPKAPAFAKPADISDASIFDNEDAPATQPEFAPASKPSELKGASRTPAAAHPQKPAKPLIGFFSINDKFRFRRELFAGSDAAMQESLARIEGLADADTARSYCFRLGWDPESRDVKDFLTITERFFRS